MPILSIIVPIYNVQKYLSKCLDSILIQTFTDYEVILVNDGSIDQSGEICDKYASSDSRVIVIHQNNSGVSSARNIGIENAKGEFLAFVDPDDTIEENMYEMLVDHALKYNADLVVCPYNSINLIDASVHVSTVWDDVYSRINKEEIEKYIIPSLLENKTYSLVPIWNKLYKKQIFDTFNVKFDENMNYGEDKKLNFKILTLINSLVIIKQPLYNYYIRNRQSLTTIFKENLYIDYICESKHLLIELCKIYGNEKYENTIRQHYTGEALLYMTNVVNEKIPPKNKYRIFNTILSDEEFIKDLQIYKFHSIYGHLLKFFCQFGNVKSLLLLLNLRAKLIKNVIKKVDLK